MEARAIDPPASFAVRILGISLAASLTLSAALYFVWSWHWPLVGDASLMHYIVFLTERGWSPYRDFGDMNMPGTFLIEMAAMHLFGPGALAWRLFDFTLLAAATAALFSIMRGRWLAALFASSLFILIHGRDGLAQGGQRDLTLAVCLLGATAFLLFGLRTRRSPWPACAFGLLSGVALTIKPTAALLTLAQLLLAAYVLRRSAAFENEVPTPDSVGSFHVVPVCIGYAIVPAICLLFLVREHAVAAFLEGLHTVVPYYASLGRKPLSYILLHSLSPILSLAILWLAVLLVTRPPLFRPGLDITRVLLLLGVFFGFVHCMIQGRALPYYRYPLLAFLLPLMAIDFTRAAAFQSRRTLRMGIAQTLAIVALALGGFFLAPQSAILIHRDRWWQTDFIASLEQDLQSLGGAQLSGQVQCIDWVSGCNTVLYDMRLEPFSGVLTDYLIFGIRPKSEDIPAVRETRAKFTRELEAHPPQVIVVTSRLFLGDLEDYRKLDLWPSFAAFLANHYSLRTDWRPTRTERWWSREEYPAGYRIYVLRAAPSLVSSGNP